MFLTLFCKQKIKRYNIPVRGIEQVLRDSQLPPRRNCLQDFDEQSCVPCVASNDPFSNRRPYFSNPDPPRHPKFTNIFDL